jgi:hypothetical protein
MHSTKDIIKVLPFTEEFKKKLLERYDTLTDDQRFAIERIIWELYDAIYEARLDENMQLAHERAKHNEEKLDHDFYNRVRQQTEEQMKQEETTSKASVDLSHTREELAKILG